MLSEISSLAQIETELKKRLNLPYHWGKVQNNWDDKLSNFVYEILYYEDVLSEIENRFKEKSDYESLFNYTLNRWFNFWSAMAIEKIFCSFPQVKAASYKQDRLVDFEIKGIQFDHKSSVFPKNYPKDIQFARQNPQHLITWLYQYQSQENRLHYKNRIFVVFFDTNGEHWKLKAEIAWLKELVEDYLNQFSYQKLLRLYFIENEVTISDVIWAVK